MSAPYLARARRVAIRREADDQSVASIETVAPSDKRIAAAVHQFVAGVTNPIGRGVNVLLVDVFSPEPFDAGGMHGALWSGLGGCYEPPAGRPLTATVYTAARPAACHVASIAVGDTSAELQLPLAPNHCVGVPLGSTHMSAFDGFPQRWERVIESPPA